MKLRSQSAHALDREAFEKLSPEARYRLYRKQSKEIADMEDKLGEQKKSLDAISALVEEGFRQCREIYSALNKTAPKMLEDDGCYEALVSNVSTLMTELAFWITQAYKWFLHTPFSKQGPDLPSHTPPSAAASGAVTSFDTSLKNNAPSLGFLFKSLKRSLRKWNNLKKQIKNSANPAAVALSTVLRDLMERDIPDKGKQPTKSKKGKKPNKNFNSKTKKKRAVHKSEGTKCPSCGTKMKKVADVKQRLMAINQTSGELLKAVENINEVQICPDCGEVSVAVEPSQDLNVVPNRTVSQGTMIHICDAMYHGIPMHQFTKVCKEKYHMGGNVLSSNMHDFCHIYLYPLVRQFIEPLMQQSEVVVVDETRFNCLQAQGRGNLSKKQRKEMKRELKKSTNFIQAISSTSLAGQKFAIYHFINGRANADIQKYLEGCAFKTLITDGYASYNNIAKKWNRKHQVCLVHLRRKIIQAVCPDGLVENLKGKTEDEVNEYLISLHEADEPAHQMLTLIKGISNIYKVESSVDTSRPGFEEELLKQRKISAVIMDQIDYVMQHLAEGRVEKRGNKWQGRRGDPFAPAIVYWLNNRENFRVFLTDPHVVPDSNIVENAIRPMVVLRRNLSGWKQNAEYVEDMCIIYSLFETIRRNGRIHDVRAYLTEYCHALWQHCVQRRLSEVNKAGGDLSVQIKDWDMIKLSEGFDASKWSPLRYRN